MKVAEARYPREKGGNRELRGKEPVEQPLSLEVGQDRPKAVGRRPWGRGRTMLGFQKKESSLKCRRIASTSQGLTKP